MNRAEPVAAQTNSAAITLDADGTIRCSGAWTLDYLAEQEHEINRLNKMFAAPRHILFNAGEDKALYKTVMEAVAQSWSRAKQPQPAAANGWLVQLGQWLWSYVAHLGSGLSFIGEASAVSFSARSSRPRNWSNAASS